MRLSDQGKYSTTAQRYSKQICKKLQDHYTGNIKDAIITDACAGNGGDTVVFATNFRHVYAIEKDPNEFRYLSGNISFAKLQNITLINKSFLDTDYVSDIIYFDPPWGGPDYKLIDNIDLYLDEINISKIVFDLVLENDVKLIALKVPHNFNYDEFQELIPRITKKYTMAKFDLIIVCV